MVSDSKTDSCQRGACTVRFDLLSGPERDTETISSSLPSAPPAKQLLLSGSMPSTRKRKARPDVVRGYRPKAGSDAGKATVKIKASGCPSTFLTFCKGGRGVLTQGSSLLTRVSVNLYVLKVATECVLASPTRSVVAGIRCCSGVGQYTPTSFSILAAVIEGGRFGWMEAQGSPDLRQDLLGGSLTGTLKADSEYADLSKTTERPEAAAILSSVRLSTNPLGLCLEGGCRIQRRRQCGR